jgi:hypothetical protein
MGVAFYKGANTTTPIADFDSTNSSTDITGLTAPSGSMMVGAVGGFYQVPTVTDNSQTQLILEETHGFGVAQKADSDSFYFTLDYVDRSVVAIIINPAASAAALPRRALSGPFYGSLRGSVQ